MMESDNRTIWIIYRLQQRGQYEENRLQQQYEHSAAAVCYVIADLKVGE